MLQPHPLEKLLCAQLDDPAKFVCLQFFLQFPLSLLWVGRLWVVQLMEGLCHLSVLQKFVQLRLLEVGWGWPGWQAGHLELPGPWYMLQDQFHYLLLLQEPGLQLLRAVGLCC